MNPYSGCNSFDDIDIPSRKEGAYPMHVVLCESLTTGWSDPPRAAHLTTIGGHC